MQTGHTSTVYSAAMKYLLIAVAVLSLSACGADAPAAPTTTTVIVAAPTPAPILKANVQLASSTATFSCVTGLCLTLTFPITNLGPGCATTIQVTDRAFGSDGAGPQLGVDIPMGLPGSSLATLVLRPGGTVTLENIASFNDIRSNHTVFKASIAWKDTGC